MSSLDPGAAPGASAEVAHRLVPQLITRPDATERPITVDQTNRSVVVDEAVIVKWFTVPASAAHPGLDLLRHLTELEVDEVPRLLGVEHRDNRVVATLSEYLAGAVDGWEWFVDELLADELGAPTHAGNRTATTWAANIGALAGRIHIALATPSSVLREPVGTAPIDTEIARCRRLIDEASASTLPEVASVLTPRLREIRAAIRSLDGLGPTVVQPIHADLHIGQFLRSEHRLAVTDFDGDPVGGIDLAGRRRPAAVDLASLVQSVDHAGRIATRRAPDRRERIEVSIDRCADTLLAAYRSELERAGRSELLDERLLPALRVGQELHELVYATRHLPRWAYAPLGTLRAMFPDH